MGAEKRWAVIDKSGIIAEGSEDEARAVFDSPDTEWTGDLLLVEIHLRKR